MAINRREVNGNENQKSLHRVMAINSREVNGNENQRSLHMVMAINSREVNGNDTFFSYTAIPLGINSREVVSGNE